MTLAANVMCVCAVYFELSACGSFQHGSISDSVSVPARSGTPLCVLHPDHQVLSAFDHDMNTSRGFQRRTMIL